MSEPAVRILAIVQARMSSSRLPHKVLLDVCGRPMIVRQLERIKRARLLDKVVVATSTDVSDDILAETLGKNSIAVFRGNLDDVLDRFFQTLRAHPAEHVVRLTADCPLTDPDVIDAVIAHHLVNAADITSNSSNPTFPDGLDVEVVRGEILNIAAREAEYRFEREHVTQFFYRRRERFKVLDYKAIQDFSSWRWTVDHPKDFQFVSEVYSSLYATKPEFGFWDIHDLIVSRPDLVRINSDIERNEGLERSIADESNAGNF